jgi:hypothetical protein
MNFYETPSNGSEIQAKTYFGLHVNCPYLLPYLNETYDLCEECVRSPSSEFSRNSLLWGLDVGANVLRSSCKVPFLPISTKVNNIPKEFV